MPRDKLPNQSNPDPDFLDKLFGEPAELSDEEVNALFDSIAPESDPAEIVHTIAESAAVQHRLQNRRPPDHVQAALHATRKMTTLENAPPSSLQKIVDALTGPLTGPVSDPAYAYRNRDADLVPDDQAIIEELTDQLREDWDEGESERK